VGELGIVVDVDVVLKERKIGSIRRCRRVSERHR
jgi:hypothetical protein